MVHYRKIVKFNDKNMRIIFMPQPIKIKKYRKVINFKDMTNWINYIGHPQTYKYYIYVERDNI